MNNEPTHIVWTDEKTWCGKDIAEVSHTRPLGPASLDPKNTCKECLNQVPKMPW
jgi:hypothetical protein